MESSDIISIIEKMAPLGAAASWDASGIQVAAQRSEITHVVVLLDPVLEGLKRAVDAGAEFILVHHPLSMQPRYPNRNDEYLAILSLLFTHRVWLYSAHTSLDANPRGPVFWLAHALRLQNLHVLEPVDAVESVHAVSASEEEAEASLPSGFGFGFVGDLPRALPYGEFCSTLAVALGKEEWQGCGPRPGQVRRVACCPGSGGGLVAEAVKAGADVFITGDVKYHAALEAQSAGIRVLDVGHFCLEEEMMRRFAEYLKAMCDVKITFFPGCDPLVAERVPGSITAGRAH